MVEKEVLDCMNDILDIVVKKEESRLYQKEWYEKNKEKRIKQMKEHYEENKEKYKEQQKEHYEKNKEKIKERHKEHYEKNKEYFKQYSKEYNQTEKGIKSNRISKWKCRGLICDNYDALYEHYLKTAYCDACKVELTYDKRTTATTKCMDHCHETGLFRNILCNLCNIKRGQNKSL